MAVKNVGWLVYEPAAGDNTAAWAAAVATGKPLWVIDNGNRVQLSAGVSFGNRDLIVKAEQVIFEMTANALPFLVVRTMGTAYSISALDNVEFDVSEGSNDNSRLTRLTLSPGDAAQITVGEFYRIASEDAAPGGATSEVPRMGETRRVVSVNTGTGHVYLDGELYREDLYVTTPTIARLNGQDYRTRIEGVRFLMGDAGVAGNWTQPMIWMEGGLSPVIDVEILRGANSGIVMRGNHRPSVKALIRKIHYAVGAVGGYGILANSDTYGRYDVRGGDCRHLFTTNWATGNTGNTLRHGPMLGAVVTGFADGCSGAGFDLHSDAHNCEIRDVVSANNYNGKNEGLGCGIQLRGLGNRAVNCRTYGNEWGIQAFANEDGSGNDTISDDLTIEGLQSDDKRGSVLLAGISTLAKRMRVNIRGGHLRSSSALIVQASEADVKFDGTILDPRGQAGGVLLDLDGGTNIRGTIRAEMRDAGGSWTLASSTGTNEISVTTKSDAADATPGDAAYAITDLSPDVLLFSTTLTADRAVSSSVQGRKLVWIKRTAGGAFNLNVAHAGGTLALVQNRAALVQFHGGTAMLVSGPVTIG